MLKQRKEYLLAIVLNQKVIKFSILENEKVIIRDVTFNEDALWNWEAIIEEHLL